MRSEDEVTWQGIVNDHWRYNDQVTCKKVGTSFYLLGKDPFTRQED